MSRTYLEGEMGNHRSSTYVVSHSQRTRTQKTGASCVGGDHDEALSRVVWDDGCGVTKSYDLVT